MSKLSIKEKEQLQTVSSEEIKEGKKTTNLHNKQRMILYYSLKIKKST
jgi:hypothetical protein